MGGNMEAKAEAEGRGDWSKVWNAIHDDSPRSLWRETRNGLIRRGCDLQQGELSGSDLKLVQIGMMVLQRQISHARFWDNPTTKRVGVTVMMSGDNLREQPAVENFAMGIGPDSDGSRIEASVVLASSSRPIGPLTITGSAIGFLYACVAIMKLDTHSPSLDDELSELVDLLRSERDSE